MRIATTKLKKRRGPCILLLLVAPAIFVATLLIWNNGRAFASIHNHETAESASDLIAAYIKEMDLSKVPPPGSPPNLTPEIKSVEEQKAAAALRTKHHYGGATDNIHLGGFTTVDPMGISPRVWTDMMEYFGVKSVLDVGCGRGVSTSWFFMQGVNVQCVEGSGHALQHSLLPALVPEESYASKTASASNQQHHVMTKENIAVQHDFSLGPWWPEKTVDAVWCVELLEHVGRNFAPNYLTAFKKSALIFATHSNWGGWHHTEVHDDDWWRAKFTMYGFQYSEVLTMRVRDIARKEKMAGIKFPVKDGDDKDQTYCPQHVFTSMNVFINPAVASRPEHAHLLSEPGCYNSRRPVGDRHAACGTAEDDGDGKIINTPLPDKFNFIPYKEDKHKEWEAYLLKNTEGLDLSKAPPVSTSETGN